MGAASEDKGYWLDDIALYFHKIRSVSYCPTTLNYCVPLHRN